MSHADDPVILETCEEEGRKLSRLQATEAGAVACWLRGRFDTAHPIHATRVIPARSGV